MSKEEQLFSKTGKNIKGAEPGQLFGKPCFKVKGKAFVCLFESCMVFKLPGNAHGQALNLDGSQLFDPSKKGRPMKEWVQVEYAHGSKWNDFAKAAFGYVKNGK